MPTRLSLSLPLNSLNVHLYACSYSIETYDKMAAMASRLRYQLVDCADLIKLIKEREEFIATWQEFEARAKDPARFKGSSVRLVKVGGC